MRKCLIVAAVIFLIPFYAFSQDLEAQFKNVSLKDFLLFISEFTGKSIVFDESQLKGNITIDTKAELTEENLLEILSSVLAVNDFYAVDKGNYIQIIKRKDIEDYSDRLVDSDKVKKGDFVTSVISLDMLNLDKVVPSLARLKSRYGTIQTVIGLNVVVVRDESDRIIKIKQVLEEMKKYAKNVDFRAFGIKNAMASNIEGKIKEFFKQLNTQSLIAFDPVIISDDYTNTIIVGAKSIDMEKIEYLITQLDVPYETTSMQPQVYPLKNVKAEDVENILNKLLPTTVDPKNKNVLTSKVASDKSTNSIVALGEKELYNNISALIQKLDVPRKQVYVEALIIETTLENGFNFGVEWLTGAGSSDFAGTAGFLNTGSLMGFQQPVLDGDSPNFGALPGGFTGTILGNVITYEGVRFPTLSALVNFVKSESKINIISNPQILTLDNEEAEVFVGENRPFLTSTKFDANNNPVQSYDYRDVGIRLKITPHIVDNKTLTMQIEQEVKKVMASAISGDQTAPITLTRQTKTNVELGNGYIVAISGLIGDDISLTNSKVPGLGDIPLIGWLFKSKNTTRTKTNLMVFISAQIINTRDDLDLITSEKQQYMDIINKRASEEIK